MSVKNDLKVAAIARAQETAASTGITHRGFLKLAVILKRDALEDARNFVPDAPVCELMKSAAAYLRTGQFSNNAQLG